MARLSETLQAHMWSNITMKGRDPTTTSQTQSGAHSSTPQRAAENDRDNVTKPEAKATASASKEEVRNRVGKFVALFVIRFNVVHAELNYCIYRIAGNFRMVEIFLYFVLKSIIFTNFRKFPCTIIMFYVTMLSCTNI